MLSLRQTLFQPSSRSIRTLTDFPSEILDLILRYVYQASGNHLSSIFPASRTCRLLRVSTYPILFETVTINTTENVIYKRSWYLLQHLLTCQHLLKYVRCLEIQTSIEAKRLPKEIDAVSAKMGQALSRKRLIQCLGLMTGLKHLKFHCLTDMNFEILEHLQTRCSFQVSMDLSDSDICLDIKQVQRLRRILSSSPGWICSFSLPLAKHSQRPTDAADLLAISQVSAIDWRDNWSTLGVFVSKKYRLPDLEELHISSKILQVQEHLLKCGVVPWSSLKRLHVEGDRQIQNLLSYTVDKLTTLEDLCLHASTTDAFHSNCLDSSRRPPRENLAYTKLPRLRHLSLRGVCPHIHVRHLTTPTLQTLVLLLPEYHARLRSITEARPPAEIKWLANNIPHLSHLELHTGSLENLWHPTAIPGVEVNVEVYGVLQAITQIKQLKTLRIFPPYVPRNAGHDYLNARQPLSDGQAVRVFHHLHNQRPSLHTLSIAATFYALRGFSPMSWMVRDRGGGKTLLTTRQAGKDYELEQVWIGERRLTTRTKKHEYRKAYLADLKGGWVFPVEDPCV